MDLREALARLVPVLVVLLVGGIVLVILGPGRIARLDVTSQVSLRLAERPLGIAHALLGLAYRLVERLVLDGEEHVTLLDVIALLHTHALDDAVNLGHDQGCRPRLERTGGIDDVLEVHPLDHGGLDAVTLVRLLGRLQQPTTHRRGENASRKRAAHQDLEVALATPRLATLLKVLQRKLGLRLFVGGHDVQAFGSVKGRLGSIGDISRRDLVVERHTCPISSFQPWFGTYRSVHASQMRMVQTLRFSCRTACEGIRLCAFHALATDKSPSVSSTHETEGLDPKWEISLSEGAGYGSYSASSSGVMPSSSRSSA